MSQSGPKESKKNTNPQPPPVIFTARPGNLNQVPHLSIEPSHFAINQANQQETETSTIDSLNNFKLR